MMDSFTSSDLISRIKKEIETSSDVILSGQSGQTTRYTESINSMVAGYPTMEDKPVMHPYGYSSRAPSGTVSIVAKQGNHPGNRVVLGHKDVNRPEINSGDVILYNQYGQEIYLEDGEIHIGKKTSNNPAVVGNELKEMLQELLILLSTHTHVSNVPGAATSNPVESSDFLQIKANFVDNDEILSDYIFLDKEI